MKIGLTVWNERISPVFDAARQMLVLDIEDGQVAARNVLQLDAASASPLERIGQLRASGVEVLICGALSNSFASLLAQSGIRVIAFVAGSVPEVVAAYMSGLLPAQEYTMPGCRCGCGRRARGGGGCRQQQSDSVGRRRGQRPA